MTFAGEEWARQTEQGAWGTVDLQAIDDEMVRLAATPARVPTTRLGELLADVQAVLEDLTQQLVAKDRAHEAERQRLETLRTAQDRELSDLRHALADRSAAPSPNAAGLAEREAALTQLQHDLATARRDQEMERQRLETTLATRDHDVAGLQQEVTALRAARDAATHHTVPSETASAAEDPRNALARVHAQADAGRLIAAMTTDVDMLLDSIGREIGALRTQLPDDGAVTHLDHTLLQGRVLLRMLRAFAHRQEQRGRTLDLNGLVDSTRATLGRVFDDDVTLGLELAPDLPPVALDPLPIELALISVVVAVRAELPAGGHVTISTAQVPAADQDGATTSERHGRPSHVRLRVSAVPWRSRIASPELATDRWLAPHPLGMSLNLSPVEGWIRTLGGWLDQEVSSPGGLVVSLGLPDGTWAPAAAGRLQG